MDTKTIEYLHGPGSLGSDGFSILRREGSKLTEVLNVYRRKDGGPLQLDNVAEALCIILAAEIYPAELRKLISDANKGN